MLSAYSIKHNRLRPISIFATGQVVHISTE